MRWIKKLKNAWKSWTINWGALLLLVGALQDHLTDIIPFMRKYIPNEDVGMLVAAVGVVVILLRIKTTSALTDK